MPELPEVETVVRTLEKQLINDRIVNVDLRYSKIVETNIDDFKNNIINCVFKEFKRRGKYLHFIFDNESELYIHLRMEGKFYIADSLDNLNLKHIHCIFTLASGRYLCYQDTRKFGRFYFVEDKSVLKEIAKLGYEPFDDKLTEDVVFDMLQNSKLDLKSFLLDQSKICGIGNIYANEICYAMKRNPSIPVRNLRFIDAYNLLKYTREILSKAIEAGGTTIRSYTSSLNVTGLFQLQVKAHGRDGELCECCQNEIKKVMLHQRGTYYCPNCQQRENLIIGVTGTIGSGKSTVCNILKTKGYKVIDADEIQHSLMVPNGQIYNDIVNSFGDKILDNSGMIDRNKLRSIIFNDAEKKRELENISFNAILSEMKNLSQNLDVCFWEVPLLFEAGWDKYVDYTILVSSDEDIIINRVIQRSGLNEQEIKKIIAAQMPVQLKEEKANYIVKNSGDMIELENKISELLNDLKI